VEGKEGDDEEMVEVEEEEEEEEEPKLKYQRLGASVATILKADAARCLVAHEKFLVMNLFWSSCICLAHFLCLFLGSRYTERVCPYARSEW
jgi:hypothetical protein